MARINNLSNFLTDVASAIKDKKGDNTNIPASQFDIEIANLPSQGTYQEKEITITANGSQTVEPDLDYDAMTKVTINTQVPSSNLQTKMVKITNNGSVSILPDTGYDGFREANLEVDVPTGIDTSDATVTEYDMPQGITAYAKGEKITGVIDDYRDGRPFVKTSPTVYVDTDEMDRLAFMTNGGNVIMDTSTVIRLSVDNEILAEAIGLTADKIKAGETILGITGTYTGAISQEEVDTAVDTTNNILGI